MAHPVPDFHPPFSRCIRDKGEPPVLVGPPVLVFDGPAARAEDFHLGIAHGFAVVIRDPNAGGTVGFDV